MDLPLATARSISNDCNASGIMLSRSRKKALAADPAGAGSWQGHGPVERGAMLKQVCWQDLCPCALGHTLEQF